MGNVLRGIRQGEVYWIDFGPVVGSAPANRHPCVVVRNDLFNRSPGATTVVCLITSNLGRANAAGNVALKPDHAGLSSASVVNISQILTVDKSELEERIGKLSAQIVEAIKKGLYMLFDRI